MPADKEYYVRKILESTEFTHSGKYEKLLKYLVEAADKGQIPKEVTIAYEVFGIDVSKGTVNEANIRVYIHNLRKKLDSYYINDGKDDKLILKIPKGRYKVEFIKRQEKSGKLRKKMLLYFSVFILLMLVANFIFLRFFSGVTITSNDHKSLIWENFVDDEMPVLIVLGDYYLVNDNSYYDRVRYIRDSKINSEEDFEDFLKQDPQNKENLFLTRHTFLGKFAPLCINELATFFHSHNKNFEIIMSSDFKWQYLQKFNVIYVGAFKTLGLFKLYLKNSNFEYNIFPNELKFHQLEPDTTYHYFSFDSNVDNAYESDYSVVTMVPGPNQNKVLLFISSRDVGLIASTDFFTDPDKIKDFEKKYYNSDESKWFETCFKVQGLQRNVISIDLLNVNHITSSTVFEISPEDNSE